MERYIYENIEKHIGKGTTHALENLSALCLLEAGAMVRDEMESIFSMEVIEYKTNRAQLVTLHHQRQNKSPL